MSPTPILDMEQLLEALHEFASRDFPVPEVERFLRGTRLRPAALQPYRFFAPDRYTRNLVFKSAQFELLVICWQGGQKAPVHGHEGEKCWARVEEGRLLFANYAEMVSRKGWELRLLGEQEGGPGYVDGPADIHSVHNPFPEPAVTLHLYSKPYQECDIYDLEKHRKIRKALRYDTLYGRPAAEATPQGQAEA